MADLLALSTAVIDEGKTSDEVGPMNRINHELSVLTDNVAMVEAFSHSIVFDTDDGLLVFDTSGPAGGSRVVDAIQQWRKDRVNSIVYTHGHVDHVGGCGAFMEHAQSQRQPEPLIIGHENVARRFDRYNLTNGYNLVINERQFGWRRRQGPDGEARFLPANAPRPAQTYEDELSLDVGGLQVELRHARGETDDHTWAWIPQHKAICAGDFFIWNFPNAGNPQKVQRYPAEWAAAMRAMANQGAELFLPAHGLPIGGKERIAQVLTTVAGALEFLVEETLALMNQGARLNDIIHSVHIDPEILKIPYMQPLYDEPEFVVRNIWRLYGGWYDGNPAHLKPAPDHALAAQIAALAGGSLALAQRAQRVAEEDIRSACHLVEFATLAAPEDVHVHAIRAEIYAARREQEFSLMSRGIFGYAANQSSDVADGSGSGRSDE